MVTGWKRSTSVKQDICPKGLRNYENKIFQPSLVHPGAHFTQSLRMAKGKNHDRKAGNASFGKPKSPSSGEFTLKKVKGTSHQLWQV